MKPLVLLSFLAASLAGQTASVEGVVVNQSTGQPLSGAHVRVLTGDVATVTVERVYGAISDAAGHFSISGIKPGLYLIVPELTGFVFVRPPGPIPATVLALKPGQHIADQKVEMTACGFVSGHVLDDGGDPVPGAALQLRAAPPDTDFVNPFTVPLPNNTDDRGEFRIVVSPGKYYLMVMPRFFAQAIGAPPIPYIATYYPNAGSTSDATPIQVKPGQEVSALEIRLARGRALPPGGGAETNLSIGGVVTGTPDGMRALVMVMRSSQNSAAMQPFRGVQAESDGKFLLRNLPSGSYRVYGQVTAGKLSLQSAAVDVQLNGADVGYLQLQLAPGEDVGGSLNLAGETAGAEPARKIGVKLETAQPGGPGTQETALAPVGKDGSFHIPAVFPGKYRLLVEPMPAGAFISSVMLDGAAADDAGFELSHGARGDRLKIILSRDAGQLSGGVLGHDGAPLSSPLAEVLVWKDAVQVMPEHNPVTGSRYVLKNLKPGKYRVLAVDAYDFTNLAGANNPNEFAKALLGAAEEIEIKEGARLVKDLKVVAKEDIHVQPKR
jgi:Carboxypeptidase regulatory-like domain